MTASMSARAVVPLAGLRSQATTARLFLVQADQPLLVATSTAMFGCKECSGTLGV
jgi:hypothetical protein